MDETIDISDKFRTVQALEDAGAEQGLTTEPLGLAGLIQDISSKYERSKTTRLPHEQRWLRQHHNYRGLYNSDTIFRDSEQSRAFVKITKTKVLAAYGQILEILFQGNKFPLAVEPTEKPDGIEEYAHSEPGNPNPQGMEAQDNEPEDLYGYEGDGNELPPGATLQDLLGGLEEKFEGAGLVAGPAPDLTKMPQIEPAKIAAQYMEKAILDQIDETDGDRKSVV